MTIELVQELSEIWKATIFHLNFVLAGQKHSLSLTFLDELEFIFKKISVINKFLKKHQPFNNQNDKPDKKTTFTPTTTKYNPASVKECLDI